MEGGVGGGAGDGAGAVMANARFEMNLETGGLPLRARSMALLSLSQFSLVCWLD